MTGHNCTQVVFTNVGIRGCEISTKNFLREEKDQSLGLVVVFGFEFRERQKQEIRALLGCTLSRWTAIGYFARLFL